MAASGGSWKGGSFAPKGGKTVEARYNRMSERGQTAAVSMRFSLRSNRRFEASQYSLSNAQELKRSGLFDVRIGDQTGTYNNEPMVRVRITPNELTGAFYKVNVR